MLRGLTVAAASLLALAPTALAAPPAVSVASTPATGGAPLTVTLSAKGDAATYTWELGDGSSAIGPVVQHVYERPGRYVAAVTAAGADGETARAEVVVTAYALTLSAPRAAAVGTPMRFTGSLRPAVAGARVVLARDGRGINHAVTNSRGEFAVRALAVAAGVHTVRFGETVSPGRRVALRPLIEASVEGPGVVGQPLRLLGRVRPTGAGRLEVVVSRNGTRVHAASYAGPARIPLPTGAPGSFSIALRVLPADGYVAAARTVRTGVAEPRLALGMRGPSVRVLEQRLAELRYALPGTDDRYGLETYQAVLAFQKMHGLPPTGRVDARVWRELRRASTPLPRHTGTHIEVSKGRQLLFVVREGRVESIVHVSTGRTGNTPLGDWRIYRKVTGWDWTLWYPLYFLRGFAIHGYPDVPTHPASAGCVRIPMWFAPRLFEHAPRGRLVRIFW